jgi:hypothetical protein
MARRTLMLLIESEAKTCGLCQAWRFDIFSGRYECRHFGRLEPRADLATMNDMPRHPDCLRAETFAGG